MGKSGYIGNFSTLGNGVLSDDMKSKLDAETQEILQECLKDVTALLQRESELFEHLTQKLLKKEELNYAELEEIFKKYAKDKPKEISS
jgi:ATP-dependent Zn protease